MTAPSRIKKVVLMPYFELVIAANIPHEWVIDPI